MAPVLVVSEAARPARSPASLGMLVPTRLVPAVTITRALAWFPAYSPGTGIRAGYGCSIRQSGLHWDCRKHLVVAHGCVKSGQIGNVESETSARPCSEEADREAGSGASSPQSSRLLVWRGDIRRCPGSAKRTITATGLRPTGDFGPDTHHPIWLLICLFCRLKCRGRLALAPRRLALDATDAAPHRA